MTEDEQRKIFAKNLNYYISLTGKQQKEIAKDLQLSPTTFNTWCKGKIMPRMGKIQMLAEYFHIGKSDLVDDKLDSDPAMDAKILADTETVGMIKRFYALSIEDRDAIQHIINSLYEKSGAN